MDIDKPVAADGATATAEASTSAASSSAASPHAPNHLLTSATNPSLEQVESHFKPAQSSPSAWLDSLGSKAEQVGSSWMEVKKAFQKNLWHNLTVRLERIVDGQDPSALEGVDPVEMFKSFVRPLHPKMNPLKYVEIARKVARQCQDPTIHLGLLLFAFTPLRDPLVSPTVINPITRKESTLPPATSLEAQAYSLCLSSLAYAHLLNAEQDKTKARLDECDRLIKSVDIVEPIVMGGFYSVSADYHKVKADYVAFYRSSLLYLACINVETDLTTVDRQSRAHDLAIAALLGESIYNFGELLQHPILASLDGGPHEWLKQMLFVFNAGDIGKYEVLSQRLSEEPILASDADFLRQKICLMALIEAVFKRPRDERSMSFQTIAQETKLPIHEVEHLVMKALSLNLVKGSLDQVNSVAAIHWVQPRVLDQQQMEGLARQLEAWCSKVGNVGDLVSSYKQPFTAVA